MSFNQLLDVLVGICDDHFKHWSHFIFVKCSREVFALEGPKLVRSVKEDGTPEQVIEASLEFVMFVNVFVQRYIELVSDLWVID